MSGAEESYSAVSGYVADTNATREDLQELCVGLAAENDALRKALNESRGRVVDLDRKLDQAIDMLDSRSRAFLLNEWS